jgi:hypothetical protein
VAYEVRQGRKNVAALLLAHLERQRAAGAGQLELGSWSWAAGAGQRSAGGSPAAGLHSRRSLAAVQPHPALPGGASERGRQPAACGGCRSAQGDPDRRNRGQQRQLTCQPGGTARQRAAL